jgi:hypothetical protein
MQPSPKRTETDGPAAKPADPSENESLLMFMTIARPAVEPQGPDSVAVPGSPAILELSPRAMHARLLENAALRRMRGAERLRSKRMEDADYWLHAAPVAVRKACALREAKSFAPIP